MKKDIKITYKGNGVNPADTDTHISVKNIPTKLVVVSNGISYPVEECEFYTNGVIHTKLGVKTFLTTWSLHFADFVKTTGIYKE
jgi:hypothetical protein